MRRIFIFAFFFTSFIAGSFAQNAKIQLIHNSPSPEANEVDVYIDGNRVRDDFKFRQYTKFLDIAAGNHQIAVCKSTSTGPTDQPLFSSTPIAFNAGDVRYVLVNGLTDTVGYAHNPDSVNLSFGLLILTGKVNNGADSQINLTVFHGCTDAPRIKFKEETINLELNPEGIIFDQAISLPLQPAAYVIGIRNHATNELLQSYRLTLTGLGGKAALAFASGFLTPAMNKDGAPFEVVLALGEPPNDTNEGAIVATTAVDKTLYGPESKVICYPNPVSGKLTLDYTLEKATQNLNLRIQNLQGRVVYQQTEGFTPIGAHSQTLDVVNLPAGLYFYTLDADNVRSTGKFLIVH